MFSLALSNLRERSDDTHDILDARVVMDSM